MGEKWLYGRLNALYDKDYCCLWQQS